MSDATGALFNPEIINIRLRDTAYGFLSPEEGGGSFVSQQQTADDVSVDEIPVIILNTQSVDIEATNVPTEIEPITRGLASEQPPTNPLVVLNTARWWYLHGKGGADPAFRWAIEWTRPLATDTPSDVEGFDEFLDYLVTVDFADEKATLR